MGLNPLTPNLWLEKQLCRDRFFDERVGGLLAGGNNCDGRNKTTGEHMNVKLWESYWGLAALANITLSVKTFEGTWGAVSELCLVMLMVYFLIKAVYHVFKDQ